MLVDLFPNFWDKCPRRKQFSSTNGWTVDEWELNVATDMGCGGRPVSQLLS